MNPENRRVAALAPICALVGAAATAGSGELAQPGLCNPWWLAAAGLLWGIALAFGINMMTVARRRKAAGQPVKEDWRSLIVIFLLVCGTAALASLA